jgi:hypothetical protein
MRAAAIKEIIYQLDGMVGDEATKRKAKEIVRRIASSNGITSADRLDRVGFAIVLLDAKEDRQVIRNRLAAKYSVSLRTAQRVIETALQLRQKPPNFGAHTGYSDEVE